MDFFTDKFGFKSDDLDAVTAELSRVLDMPVEPHFYEGFGGDYSAFGEHDELGGQLSLYRNRFHNGREREIHEEDFPELGLVLLIEQQGQHVDYVPILQKIQSFKPILLYRDRYLERPDKSEVLFDLAKEEGRSAPQ
ncbi:MAG: hypothetical protein MJE12_12480 [Alphaproteobacteria bacterium]|nr:hypothetical protein [Alphaproteobacteria bacterium]